MKNFIILTIIFLVALTSCDNINNKSGGNALETVYRKISAADAFQKMSEADGYILLDVRTEQEFNESRIKNAVLIPDYEIADRAAAELPDKNALIFIYCRSGRRSANATNELVGLGYANVYDFGGILDWPYGVEP